MSSLVRKIQKKGRWVGAPGKGTPVRLTPPRGRRRGKPSKFRVKKEEN